MTATLPESTSAPPLETLWLDLTRNCPLTCSHCYNDSGPQGTHGTMTREDWIRVINDAAQCDVRRLQFIGGEPTTHPDFAALVGHALNLRLNVEVFTNLVHVTDEQWQLLTHPRLSLATSYYSDDADEHNAITNRRSHTRTRANISTAVNRGIPLRVGIIAISDEQRVAEARRDLETLGVTSIHVDRIRPFGRGSPGDTPDPAHLCGQCGTGKAAISPSGEVTPCVFSEWMTVGSVHTTRLADILSGPPMARACESIRATPRTGLCDPDGECSPGVPDSSCSPRS
jgi:MoaA/NifB/PqqE/SkfB family radical SAM enzyme